MHCEPIVLHDVSDWDVTRLLLVLYRILEDAFAVDCVLRVSRLVLREGRLLLVLLKHLRLVALPVIPQRIFEGYARLESAHLILAHNAIRSALSVVQSVV